MARPKKEPHEQRSASVRADLTLGEKEHIRRQATLAGLSEAEYVRRRALDYTVPSSSTSRRADPALVTEINRLGVELKALGNNANQLARAVHTDRHFHGRWEEIADAIADARDRVSDALSRAVST